MLKDAIPVLSTSWHSMDEAFYNFTEGIRKVVDLLTPKQPEPQPVSPAQEGALLMKS